MRTVLSTALVMSLLSSPLTSVAVAPPSAAFSQSEFSDVDKDHPYAEAIEYLRTNNVLKGYPDGTFKPTRRISRSEFIMLAVDPFILHGERLHDCLKKHVSAESNNVFYIDVQKSDWFSEEVCIANVEGIINGYPDGTFKPYRSITFVEAAKIMTRIFALDVRRDTPEQDVQWYTAYVQKLSELRAIPSTIHSLAKPLTREEVAEMLFRLTTNTTNRLSRNWEDFSK